MGRGRKTKLTDKRKRFCLEYIKHSNATKAAKDAGFSEKTAGEQGKQLLQNPIVSEYLESLQKKIAEETGVSVKWVIDKLQHIVDECLIRQEIYSAKGTPTGTFKIDSSGANGALKSIGLHLGMFKEKMDMNISGDLEIKHRLFDEE